MKNIEHSIIDMSASPEIIIPNLDAQNKIDSFTKYLLTKNIPYQSRVIIIGQNSIWAFIAIMAIRKAGLVAVPLTNHQSNNQIKEIAKLTKAQLVVGEKQIDFEEKIEFINFHHLEQISEIHYENDIPKFPKDRIALIIFTSGSTGKQKGVSISEGARRAFIIANAVQETENSSKNSPTTITIIATPFSHILANNLAESVFAKNQTMLLLPKFDPQQFINSVVKYKVSKLSMVPSMWSMILSKIPNLKDYDLSFVKHIYFSSEPLNHFQATEAEKYFYNAKIENCYGISEAGPNLFGPHPQDIPRPILSVGYPRKGIEYRIVNNELEIKTPFMMKEYINQPDLTKTAITADGFYKTKDQFSIDSNGFYFFNSRTDNLIISGGKNIYPQEIENILRSHDSVFDCAVISLADQLKGKKAYAFVVVKNNSTATEDILKEHILKQSSPSFIPKRIWIIEKLPMGANLKIDYKNLEKFALDELSKNT